MDTIPVQAPNGLQEILDHYGDPKPRIVNGEWCVDPAWESANCISIEHDLLVGATPHGRLYVHKQIAAPLLRLLNRWAARIAAGDTYRVKHIACFAPRAQRGTHGLIASTHTWAIAFDLNPDDNALISDIDPSDPRRATAKDIPDAWIADAIAEGFFWGGRFGHRFDPMHFQLATGY